MNMTGKTRGGTEVSETVIGNIWPDTPDSASANSSCLLIGFVRKLLELSATANLPNNVMVDTALHIAAGVKPVSVKSAAISPTLLASTTLI